MIESGKRSQCVSLFVRKSLPQVLLQFPYRYYAGPRFLFAKEVLDKVVVISIISCLCLLLLFQLLSHAFCSPQCSQTLLEITLQYLKTLPFNLCSFLTLFPQASLFFHKSIDPLLPSGFGLCWGLVWCS